MNKAAELWILLFAVNPVFNWFVEVQAKHPQGEAKTAPCKQASLATAHFWLITGHSAVLLGPPSEHQQHTPRLPPASQISPPLPGRSSLLLLLFLHTIVLFCFVRGSLRAESCCSGYQLGMDHQRELGGQWWGLHGEWCCHWNLSKG